MRFSFIYTDLNMFSSGSFCKSAADSVNVDTIDDVVDMDEVEVDKVASSLGKKTMTVLPTVVTNSSKPNTVLVSIPSNNRKIFHQSVAKIFDDEIIFGAWPGLT